MRKALFQGLQLKRRLDRITEGLQHFDACIGRQAGNELANQMNFIEYLLPEWKYPAIGLDSNCKASIIIVKLKTLMDLAI